MTWMNAIISVLREAGEPMEYTQVAQAIIDRGLRNASGSVNPVASVASTVSQYLRNQGDRCEVVRLKRGQLGLREWGESDLRLGSSGTATSRVHGGQVDLSEPEIQGIPDGMVEYGTEGLITSFGMYWRRDQVKWSNRPRILGAQQLGAKIVDFAEQIGLYVLYDGSRPIYVGQVSRPRLGVRLFEHTRDRLNGRWQRFSWFGLRPVMRSGNLGNFKTPTEPLNIFIDTLEAIIIEIVEPVQNRRVGNGFSTIEYIQAEDPDIASAQQRALAMRIINGQLS